MTHAYTPTELAMIVSAGAILVAVVYRLELLWTARRQRRANEAVEAALDQSDVDD